MTGPMACHHHEALQICVPMHDRRRDVLPEPRQAALLSTHTRLREFAVEVSRPRTRSADHIGGRVACTASPASPHNASVSISRSGGGWLPQHLGC